MSQWQKAGIVKDQPQRLDGIEECEENASDFVVRDFQILSKCQAEVTELTVDQID